MAKPQPGASARFTCPTWVCPYVAEGEEASCPYRRERDDGKRSQLKGICIEYQKVGGGKGGACTGSPPDRIKV